MKTLIKKLKSFSIITFVRDLFKHDCSMNQKLVSASFFKDGDSGVYFSTGKTYCCEKCGKNWND